MPFELTGQIRGASRKANIEEDNVEVSSYGINSFSLSFGYIRLSRILIKIALNLHEIRDANPRSSASLTLKGRQQ